MNKGLQVVYRVLLPFLVINLSTLTRSSSQVDEVTAWQQPKGSKVTGQLQWSEQDRVQRLSELTDQDVYYRSSKLDHQLLNLQQLSSSAIGRTDGGRRSLQDFFSSEASSNNKNYQSTNSVKESAGFRTGDNDITSTESSEDDTKYDTIMKQEGPIDSQLASPGPQLDYSSGQNYVPDSQNSHLIWLVVGLSVLALVLLLGLILTVSVLCTRLKGKIRHSSNASSIAKTLLSTKTGHTSVNITNAHDQGSSSPVTENGSTSSESQAISSVGNATDQGQYNSEIQADMNSIDHSVVPFMSIFDSHSSIPSSKRGTTPSQVKAYHNPMTLMHPDSPSSGSHSVYNDCQSVTPASSFSPALLKRPASAQDAHMQTSYANHMPRQYHHFHAALHESYQDTALMSTIRKQGSLPWQPHTISERKHLGPQRPHSSCEIRHTREHDMMCPRSKICGPVSFVRNVQQIGGPGGAQHGQQPGSVFQNMLYEQGQQHVDDGYGGQQYHQMHGMQQQHHAAQHGQQVQHYQQQHGVHQQFPQQAQHGQHQFGWQEQHAQGQQNAHGWWQGNQWVPHQPQQQQQLQQQQLQQQQLQQQQLQQQQQVPFVGHQQYVEQVPYQQVGYHQQQQGYQQPFQQVQQVHQPQVQHQVQYAQQPQQQIQYHQVPGQQMLYMVQPQQGQQTAAQGQQGAVQQVQYQTLQAVQTPSGQVQYYTVPVQQQNQVVQQVQQQQLQHQYIVQQPQTPQPAEQVAAQPPVTLAQLSQGHVPQSYVSGAHAHLAPQVYQAPPQQVHVEGAQSHPLSVIDEQSEPKSPTESASAGGQHVSQFDNVTDGHQGTSTALTTMQSGGDSGALVTLQTTTTTIRTTPQEAMRIKQALNSAQQPPALMASPSQPSQGPVVTEIDSPKQPQKHVFSIPLFSDQAHADDDARSQSSAGSDPRAQPYGPGNSRARAVRGKAVRRMARPSASDDDMVPPWLAGGGSLGQMPGGRNPWDSGQRGDTSDDEGSVNSYRSDRGSVTSVHSEMGGRQFSQKLLQAMQRGGRNKGRSRSLTGEKEGGLKSSSSVQSMEAAKPWKPGGSGVARVPGRRTAAETAALLKDSIEKSKQQMLLKQQKAAQGAQKVPPVAAASAGQRPKRAEKSAALQSATGAAKSGSRGSGQKTSDGEFVLVEQTDCDASANVKQDDEEQEDDNPTQQPVVPQQALSEALLSSRAEHKGDGGEGERVKAETSSQPDVSKQNASDDDEDEAAPAVYSTHPGVHARQPSSGSDDAAEKSREQYTRGGSRKEGSGGGGFRSLFGQRGSKASSGKNAGDGGKEQKNSGGASADQDHEQPAHSDNVGQSTKTKCDTNETNARGGLDGNDGDKEINGVDCADSKKPTQNTKRTVLQRRRAASQKPWKVHTKVNRINSPRFNSGPYVPTSLPRILRSSARVAPEASALRSPNSKSPTNRKNARTKKVRSSRTRASNASAAGKNSGDQGKPDNAKCADERSAEQAKGRTPSRHPEPSCVVSQKLASTESAGTELVSTSSEDAANGGLQSALCAPSTPGTPGSDVSVTNAHRSPAFELGYVCSDASCNEAEELTPPRPSHRRPTPVGYVNLSVGDKGDNGEHNAQDQSCSKVVYHDNTLLSTHQPGNGFASHMRGGSSAGSSCSKVWDDDSYSDTSENMRSQADSASALSSNEFCAHPMFPFGILLYSDVHARGKVPGVDTLSPDNEQGDCGTDEMQSVGSSISLANMDSVKSKKRGKGKKRRSGGSRGGAGVQQTQAAM